MAGYLTAENLRTVPQHQELRFTHVALTSVFGDPLQPATWSGAPYRLAAALNRLGVSVDGFWPRVGRIERVAFAARHLAAGFGRITTSEVVRRDPWTRDCLADRVATFVARCGVQAVVHMGTFDLPAFDLLRDVAHYLYCDHTWSLALPYRSDRTALSEKARREYERLERESLRGVAHVFTFGAYVRDEIVAHYGIPADRVTAVGSGMGEIDPYFGPKRYTTPRLLFIAKHLFKDKGGELLLAAFSRLRSKRPDATLTIVGDERSRKYVPRDRSIRFLGRLPWTELQQLYRDSTLLVQPMLNDPWGQVFLEALVSRTPVVGLNRHGLPEITEYGRHGFLVEESTPEALAETMATALSDPERLSQMGISGQRHAINSYSWDRTAARMAFVQ